MQSQRSIFLPCGMHDVVQISVHTLPVDQRVHCMKWSLNLSRRCSHVAIASSGPTPSMGAIVFEERSAHFASICSGTMVAVVRGHTPRLETCHRPTATLPVPSPSLTVTASGSVTMSQSMVCPLSSSSTFSNQSNIANKAELKPTVPVPS